MVCHNPLWVGTSRDAMVSPKVGIERSSEHSHLPAVIRKAGLEWAARREDGQGAIHSPFWSITRRPRIPARPVSPAGQGTRSAALDRVRRALPQRPRTRSLLSVRSNCCANSGQSCWSTNRATCAGHAPTTHAFASWSRRHLGTFPPHPEANTSAQESSKSAPMLRRSAKRLCGQTCGFVDQARADQRGH